VGSVRALSGATKPVLLTDRRLIAVGGPDSTSFMQGLVTNDVHRLSPGGGSQTALFANFLNAKGRFRFDAFIASYSPSSPLMQGLRDSKAAIGEEGYLLDTSEDQVATLGKYLKMRTLGSKVKVSPVPADATAVCQHLPLAETPVRLEEGDSKGAVLLFADPRSERMGVRSLQVGSSLAFSVSAGEDSGAALYRARRLLCGIAEGPQELEVEKTVPLEASLHYYDTVCFNKGCYVGQELMARVHYTGTLRKQAVTLLLDESKEGECEKKTEWTSFGNALSLVGGGGAGEASIKAGDTVTFAKGPGERTRRIGKVLAVEGRVALTMVRFHYLEGSDGSDAIDGTVYVTAENGRNIAADAVVRPHWWESRPVER